MVNKIINYNITVENDPVKKWRPKYLFKGSIKSLPHFTCHVSTLNSNYTPHLPHAHAEEELLVLLHGKAELYLPEFKQQNLIIEAGEFVYYPANFPHTLKSIGNEPANYLMLKWQSGLSNKNGLSFKRYGIKEIVFKDTISEGTDISILFERRTKYLNKLHCHITRLEPGGGYAPHKDDYDVVLIMLKGTAKTGNSILQKYGVAIHSAGVAHGIRNLEETDAQYLVFEFHGNNKNFLFRVNWFIKKLLGFLISPERWVYQAKKIAKKV